MSEGLCRSCGEPHSRPERREKHNQNKKQKRETKETEIETCEGESKQKNNMEERNKMGEYKTKEKELVWIVC